MAPSSTSGLFLYQALNVIAPSQRGLSILPVALRGTESKMIRRGRL